MKSWLILLMLAVSLVGRGTEASTNLLSIYLLADQSAWRGVANLSVLKLVEEPVITDVDIVGYDSYHGFAISAEAGNRLARALWQTKDEAPWFRENGDYEFIPFDTPFVAVSFGQRLRLGWFTSLTSSTAYFHKPTIQPGFRSYLINTNTTTNVWLRFCRTYGNCSASPLSQNTNDVRRAAVEVFRRANPESELFFSPNGSKIIFDNSINSNQSIRIR